MNDQKKLLKTEKPDLMAKILKKPAKFIFCNFLHYNGMQNRKFFNKYEYRQ